MGLFGAAHGWGGGLSKICHTYPIMMKLGTVIPYLSEIQKLSAKKRSAFFHQKSENFAISRNTDIDCNTLK